ncbi:unnamed protein product [Rotaria sp. Silwood1]|nr:unnamed protein product [Rotaria sp. Silwood1]CAF3663139.1 unnamed protein product [Rotaria sp. Silwood1]CAF3680551.1 unnamed protein product [Rotaria sp. Silwood1]CAF3724926.1 unnamed protein product [Rotaria sp. Silwood1]
MNDKQKQSNKIRRFCKEYNIELQDESSLSSNPRYERTENYEASLNNDGGITVMYEQNVHQQIFNEVQILPFQSIASDQQSIHKRKADEICDLEPSPEENTPLTKKLSELLVENHGEINTT